MDRQICFFGTTLQLRQESVQTPRFNTNNLVPSENLGVVHQERRLESPWWDTITNHVVPFGELRLLSTKAAINKSDSVHEGTENLAVVCHKRLVSPGRDTNHVDPFGELRLPLTCPRRNESDLVQDGLKGKEESSIVTGTDVENHVSLDVEHIQPPSGFITTEYDDLSLDRRSDLVSSAENHQHPLDLEDIETPLSHTMMDNQSCLVDKPSEEHHERGLCNIDCLVPFEESRSQLTSHESIESEFVQEESERRDVALEENVEDHVSLIDCFTENQMKEHIASLNPSMNEVNTPVVDTGRRDDARLDNELFKNRDLFLSFCQYKHYQFDTLRRAKHSTMMILNHLKAQCGFKIPSQVQVVNQDLPGALEPPALKPLSLEPPSISKAENETLVHASRCSRNNGCTNVRCRQLKMLFSHGTTCNTKRGGGCKLCENLWNLLLAHSMRCEDLDCRVPRCGDMKKEFLQHKKRERHK